MNSEMCILSKTKALCKFFTPRGFVSEKVLILNWLPETGKYPNFWVYVYLGLNKAKTKQRHLIIFRPNNVLL